MKRITVCYVITGLYVGGAEKLILALSKRLNRDRFRPIVCTLVGSDMYEDFRREGIPVFDIAMHNKFDLRGFFRLRRLFLKERPDIVHTHLFHADLLGRIVAWWCRVPAIVTTFHMLEEPRRRWLIKTVDRWASRFNHALVAVSEEVKHGIAQIEGINPACIEVIPNAVETTPPDLRLCRQMRRKLGVPADGQLIGLTSRLEAPRKGHLVLFQALRLLADIRPDLHCVIVGDGPDRALLESKARELGLSRRVHFVGMRSDIETWLGMLDVFAFPSLHEGLPLSVIEAMAANCPIVSTPVGGISGLLTHEDSALFVAPNDAEALAAAIDRLLRDRMLAERLGKAAGKRFVERQFDMRQRIHRTESLYERLLKPKSAPPVKILEVVTTLDTGGVTTYLCNLIRALPRDRFAITLASGPDELQADLAKALNVPHHIVALCKPLNPIKDLKALWQLWRLMRRERFALVHTNMCKADAIGGLAARLAGVPCIISTAHGPLQVTRSASMEQALFDAIERFVYRYLHHRIISVSSATTKILLRKGKVRPLQVVTIPNGLDVLHAPSTTPMRHSVRQGLGLNPDQPVLIMVGRLKTPKAPEVLIDSVRQLIHAWPDLSCLVVGDGEYAQALQKQVRRHALEASVKLLGQRRDVPALLQAADLFVLATYSEGMPMSVLEAMAAGLPVVASGVSGMNELVADGQTGLLVPPGNAEAQASAIDLLLRNPSRRSEMGKAAAERIREKFHLKRHVERTQQVFLESV